MTVLLDCATVYDHKYCSWHIRTICSMWKGIDFHPIKISEDGNDCDTRTEMFSWENVISKADVLTLARNVCLFFPTSLPACFKRRTLRYACSFLPLQALCKYSCPPLPAGCWSILQVYIRSSSVPSVIKLNGMMYTMTTSLNRKVAHIWLYGRL